MSCSLELNLTNKTTVSYSINFYICTHVAILFRKYLQSYEYYSLKIHGYSNSVFPFPNLNRHSYHSLPSANAIDSVSFGMQPPFTRGIRSIGRRKVEINCLPSLYSVFYATRSRSLNISRCVQNSMWNIGMHLGMHLSCHGFDNPPVVVDDKEWERERGKKNLSRVLRRFCVQLYLSCGLRARDTRKGSFVSFRKRIFEVESCELKKLEHRVFESYFYIDSSIFDR